MYFNEKRILEDKYLGRTIRIFMQDRSEMKRFYGVVTSVDDAGQLHGTWGGLAAIPGIDDIYIISENKNA